ncbi:ThuA domain-containing protein [Lignipirellula cremea]|uniref:Trehalose utilization n=1 Tax=Lignipirellula cremea TaxID=2528010 RepID=A0A518DMM9_9BACT|nr:ThuA domain-containing protein [Lignipirellula cremea]QDU93071.1 Trehalose utilization [Lignipirellula cremea]
MYRSLLPVLLLTLLAVSGNSRLAQAAKPEPLRGLIVTGGCCHDYPRQTLILKEGLSQRIAITWDVVHESDAGDTRISIFEKPDWTKGYDVVLHNECYANITDPKFIGNIVNAHKDTGVGAIVIHCATHTFRAAETDEWRKLLGVTTRRHERTKRSLEVVNQAPQHPIMQNFPKSWNTPNGELYVIENMWPHAAPLAAASSTETKKDEICMWTNEYGKARIFGTTLGHHNETMMADEWLDTVAQAVLWTTRRLDENGEPTPGYEGTGKAPFSFQRNDGPQPTPADPKSKKK